MDVVKVPGEIPNHRLAFRIFAQAGTARARRLAMAMRDLVDAAGVQWLVWDIRPEEAHPITRFEDYLQGFLDGWLVFETPDGRDRRRLHPIPRGWAELPDDELRQLLARAEDARREPSSRSAEAIAVTQPTIRSFLYPGGRLWTVSEVLVQYRDPEGEPLGEPRTVLRFAAGRRSLDLLAWPPDWTEYDEAALCALLSRAFPRRTMIRDPDAPARRKTDAPSAAEER